VTVIFAPVVFAQSGPKFEAATIKPAEPMRGFGIQITGMRFNTPSSSLSNLIGFVYGIHPAV
jgi:hypothetical protein